MRIALPLIILASAALAATGCSNDSNAPNTSHVGSYGLESVDGARLPVTVYEDSTFKVTLTQGALALNANNSFVESVKLDLMVNGRAGPPENLSCGGSYQRSGSTVTLTVTGTADCDAATVTGTLSGNVLTVSDQGSVLVFRR